MTISISLNLETWGTRPGCDIRSIGAVVFDPVAGTVATMDHTDQIVSCEGNVAGTHAFYIACDNPIKAHVFGDDPDIRRYNLHRDPRTVQWWSEQSDEAQAAFADPVDLRSALNRFAQWLCGLVNGDILYPVDKDSTGLDIRIWSHGAAFDPPILAPAYEAVGLPVPWHYRAPRDTRTLFDAAGIDDHSAWLKQHPGPLGVPHHALDDAICQARAVCAAWARLRTPSVTVKPLIWTKDEMFGGERGMVGDIQYRHVHWDYGGARYGHTDFKTMDQAKHAAQDEHEREILNAIGTV